MLNVEPDLVQTQEEPIWDACTRRHHNAKKNMKGVLENTKEISKN